jgi:endonuclease YncB( thermonuclease family)
MSRFTRNLSFPQPSRFYATPLLPRGRTLPAAGAVAFGVLCGAIGGALVWDRLLRPVVPAIVSEEPSSPVSSLTGRYAVDVVRVVDGDTFEARVHVWPGFELTTRVRLRSIDAPELKARCEAERIGAQAARDALRDILNERDVSIWSIGPDKYFGRVVAEVSTRRTADVSAAMLNRGVARSYAGGHRDGWCRAKYSG